MAGPSTDLPGGPRIGWFDLPAHVRAGIEAFIKAVGTPLNPESPAMHRSEARILAQLPLGFPAPQLLGTYDDGTWVALDDLSRRGTPAPVTGLSAIAATFQPSLRGWRRLASGENVAGLDPWTAANLKRLAAVEEHAGGAATGTTLLHADIRADNLLLTPGGGVAFVDWAWGCRGAPWIDLLAMLPSVRLAGGPPPADIWGSRALAASAPDDRVDALLAAFSGFLIRQSRRPPRRVSPRCERFRRPRAPLRCRGCGSAWGDIGPVVMPFP